MMQKTKQPASEGGRYIEDAYRGVAAGEIEKKEPVEVVYKC